MNIQGESRTNKGRIASQSRNGLYHLLVVEDDPIIARVMETILRDIGFSIIPSVNSGERAIRQIINFKPDLVLMDVDLVGPITGIETAGVIFHLFRTPVIFVTGHDEDAMLCEALLSDPFGFLLKPVNQNILSGTIHVGINLSEKISETEDGKASGLNTEQMKRLQDPMISVILCDRERRVVWMNEAAEFLLDLSLSSFLFQDVSEILRDIRTESGVEVDLFDTGFSGKIPMHLRSEKRIIPSITVIYDMFGDEAGYYLEFEPI